MAYSTDFFVNQEHARKASAQLVLYFCGAIVLIIAGIYGIVLVGLSHTDISLNIRGGFFDPLIFTAVAVPILLVIGGSTLHQVSRYSRGGGALVAEILGGKRIEPSTTDPRQRVLMNVVEEMALASGVPVPAVFVLEENGINAFAAGYSIHDAVIAVTRGALETLSRDELQGVVAHEFSHILNGDMKINLRLSGIIYGLYVLSLIGYTLLRVVGSGSSRRTQRRSNKKDGGGGVVAVVLSAGLAFMVFGFLGQIMGRLIQRAHSRQREYLADASAVQFTRNPHGVAGALKKIGGYLNHSYLKNEHAKEMSHMFFADGLKNGLASLMSTHPTLESRIRKIDPSFDGTFPEVRVLPRSTEARNTSKEPSFELKKGASIRLEPNSLIGAIGALSAHNVAYASALFESIPDEFIFAARDSYTARNVVFVLLISDEAEVRKLHLEILAEKLSTHENLETERLLNLKDRLHPQHRLALLELALPALGNMSPSQYLNFMNSVQQLITADNRIDAFEFVVRQFIKRQYDMVNQKSPYQSSRTLSQIVPEVIVLLSTLARQGKRGDETKAIEAFRNGLATFEKITGATPSKASILAQNSAEFLALDKAMELLSTVTMKNKKAIMEACVQCILSDNVVALEEFELIRAVGEMMDVPIPPDIVAS